MTPPPLAIVQARLGSTRLPRKMLLPLADRPLIWWAWSTARLAFGTDNTVVAMPDGPDNDELADTVRGFGGTVFRWDGPEDDVLGRFWHCAHRYRWHPDSVIVRVTPDDPFKTVQDMKRVARGERRPVEMGGEAFTLAMLDRWRMGQYAGQYQVGEGWVDDYRPVEHITHLMIGSAPAAPAGLWTVDTQADYEAAQELVASTWERVDITALKGAEA